MIKVYGMSTCKDCILIKDELEKRKNAKKIKAEKKAGQMLMKNTESSETDFLSKFDEQYPLLNLTVPLEISGTVVPVGHYKVVGSKNNGKVYLNLCQSYNVVAKIPAVETEDDFKKIITISYVLCALEFQTMELYFSLNKHIE